MRLFLLLTNFEQPGCKKYLIEICKRTVFIQQNFDVFKLLEMTKWVK